jgi:hypothetical protein
VSVFPRGERQLKGIDEPERVYELAIEGVETPADDEQPAAAPAAPAPPSPSPAPPAADFGERLAETIRGEVLGSLEQRLGPRGTPAADDGDLDDLAARGATLDEQIRKRVEAALQARLSARQQRD